MEPNPKQNQGFLSNLKLGSGKIRDSITAYLFVFPALLIIGVFGLFPIAFSVYVSLHKWRIIQGAFNGLDNYVKAIGNLAYVVFFWIGGLLIYLAVRSLLKRWKMRRDDEEDPADAKFFLWAIPGLVTTLGVFAFIRALVFLMPLILNIPQQLRGQTKTQELFVEYLTAAIKAPEFVQAFWISMGILAAGVALAYAFQNFIFHKSREKFLANYSFFTQFTLQTGASLVLIWFTWKEIQRVYTAAIETGAELDIWAQVITISAGLVLLLASYYLWRSASGRETVAGVVLRLVAAAMLAVGAWALIGEIPRVVEAGYDEWWEGLMATIWYSLGTVPFQLGISLVLATLLFQEIKGKSLFRLIYFLPYITPAVATAAVFRVLFASRPTAPLNQLLINLGGDPRLWLDEPKGIVQVLAGPEANIPAWLAGPSLAMVVIIIYNIWSYVGYDTVIFLAGLGGIPSDLYEAAAIDGASKWDQFRNITLPLLSPTTYFLTLLAVIGTFKAFNHVWVLRSSAALGTTDTASIVIFTEFNRNTRYGFAAALAFVLLGVILILTLINNKVAEERVFYG